MQVRSWRLSLFLVIVSENPFKEYKALKLFVFFLEFKGSGKSWQARFISQVDLLTNIMQCIE